MKRYCGFWNICDMSTLAYFTWDKELVTADTLNYENHRLSAITCRRRAAATSTNSFGVTRTGCRRSKCSRITAAATIIRSFTRQILMTLSAKFHMLQHYSSLTASIPVILKLGHLLLVVHLEKLELATWIYIGILLNTGFFIFITSFCK